MPPAPSSVFDVTYVINLDRSPERWRRVQRVAELAGFPNVQRWSAVDGAALGDHGRRALQHAGALAADLAGFAAARRDGEIGCALSHAQVLADIVARGWQRALILEDDIELAGDPTTWRARFTDAYADLPASWELWYLYRCFDIEHRIQRLTPRTVVPWTPQGGAAYAVSASGARRLLAALTPVSTAVDRVFMQVVKSRAIDAFATSPMLVDPGTQPSVISHESSDDPWTTRGVNRPPEYWPERFLAHLGESLPALTPAPGRRVIFQVTWGFEAFGGLEHHLMSLALAQTARGDVVRVFAEAPVSTQNSYARRLLAAKIPITGASLLPTIANRLGQLPLGPLRTVATLALGAVRWARRHLTENGRWASPIDEQLIAHRRFHPVTIDLFNRLDAAAAVARPDVVHVHGTRLRQWWVASWAAARRIPVVYTEHITLDEWGGPGDERAVQMIRTQVGALSCVSTRSRDSLRRWLPDGPHASVIRHIVHGPTSYLASTPHGATLRVLCVARLAAYKGVDVLLQAVARCNASHGRIHVTIAGDGPERRSLLALTTSLALSNVEFLGAIDPEQIAALMGEADVVVLPSRGEGLPVALVEAMANGRAVIATRSGGNAEVVRDGETGMLVDAADVEQLAQALVHADRDRAALARMGLAARAAWMDGAWTESAVLPHVDAMYDAALQRVTDDRRHVASAARAQTMEDSATPEATLHSVVLMTWSLHGDGAMPQHITSLAISLAERGLDVTLLAASIRPPSRATCAALRAAGVTLDVGNPWRRGLGAARGLLRHVRQVVARRQRLALRDAAVDSHLGLARMFRARVRRGHPDLIHVHGWCSSLAETVEWGRAVGSAVVYTEHAPTDEWEAARPRAEQQAAALRNVDVLECTTTGTRALLEATLHTETTEFAVREWSHDVVAAHSHAPSGQRVIALVANDAEREWIESAVSRCVTRGRAVHLFVSDVVEWSATETRLAVDPPHVFVFAPTHPRASVAARQAAANGAVLVVALDGPTRERPLGLAHRGSAFFVPPLDVEALTAAFDECAADPMLVQALSTAARRVLRPKGLTTRTTTGAQRAVHATTVYSDAWRAQQRRRRDARTQSS